MIFYYSWLIFDQKRWDEKQQMRSLLSQQPSVSVNDAGMVQSLIPLLAFTACLNCMANKSRSAVNTRSGNPGSLIEESWSF